MGNGADAGGGPGSGLGSSSQGGGQVGMVVWVSGAVDRSWKGLVEEGAGIIRRGGGGAVAGKMAGARWCAGGRHGRDVWAVLGASEGRQFRGSFVEEVGRHAWAGLGGVG